MAIVAAGSNAVRKVLRRACARNLTAELQFTEGEREITARLRLLYVQAERLCTDKPQAIGHAAALQPGQPVTVCLVADGTRYLFHTQVVDTNVSLSLNARQRITGTAFQIPDIIREQQRRADYRVSLAGSEIQVQFHETESTLQCRIDAKRFSGRMTNLSAGGMALLIQGAERTPFDVGKSYYAQFDLPGISPTFVFPVEVRHFREIHEGDSTLVGFQFIHCDVIHTRARTVQIHRFVVAEQRRQLRGKR